MAVFILKDGRRLPSWILKVGNFYCPYPSEGLYALSCQISCGSVKPLRRYGRFSIFQDGGQMGWVQEPHKDIKIGKNRGFLHFS